MTILKNYKSLEKLKKSNLNLKLGLCHGAFDVLHNGHLNHFKKAKENVDALVVSITGDKFRIKGPAQPFNKEIDRAKFLENLKTIDYIFIDQSHTAEKVIKYLKPDVYFKGKDYRSQDITENLKKELKILKKNKGNFFITNTSLMSSTKIINNYYLKQDNKINLYFRELNKNNAFKKIYKATEKLKNKTFNIIGEPIIDRYVQCEISGLTTKDPAVSTIINKKEEIPGGVFAIARIVSKFAKKVNLYTYGRQTILKKIFSKYKNIKIINLDIRQDIQTKTRYINENRYEKLLQVTNFKKNKFHQNTKKNHNNLIRRINGNLIICDFGLGLFEKNILELIESLKIKKYLNVQTNSINMGHNFFTKYKNYTYLSLDEKEWILGLGGDKNLDLNNNSKLKKNTKVSFSLTKGKRGSVYFYKNKKIDCPVFIEKTIDTTGCGDAFFAITSIMIDSNLEEDLVPFIGNVYAGMHSQFFGNKKIINKVSLLKHIKSILNR